LFLLFVALKVCFLTPDCQAESVSLGNLPPMPKDTRLSLSEKAFGFRGRIGSFVMSPCQAGIRYDRSVVYKGEPLSGVDPREFISSNSRSMRIMYKRQGPKGMCGAYVILMADLSGYKTLTFFIKGSHGGETFEVGMNDVVSDKREDAVYSGSVNRYLDAGVTTQWQLVRIPLSDFFGPDMSRIFSLVFYFNDEGSSELWIDKIRFFKEDLVHNQRAEDINRKGYFLLDDFNYSEVNLLGRKANSYKKLPSVCGFDRVATEHYGRQGRSLRLRYKKEPTGWCGYYSMLNQIDGEYCDLSAYRAVSFMVKGAKGGEKFEIGMADKNWETIGDSLKVGGVNKYLPGGVAQKWQEVVIPLKDFGLLNFSLMGSFVINFNEPGEGTIYIDDLKFYLKTEKKK
jgi:hypothetical protein